MRFLPELVPALGEAIPWVYLLVLLVGGGVCLWYRRLSARMVLLLLGFLGVFAAAVANRLAFYWLQSRPQPPVAKVQQVFAGISFASLLSWGLFVIGLAAVFADLRRRLDSKESLQPPVRARPG